MFEYQYKVKVKLNGKVVGEIRSVDGGFAYFPKGSKVHGDVYPSVEMVQGSLER